MKQIFKNFSAALAGFFTTLAGFFAKLVNLPAVLAGLAAILLAAGCATPSQNAAQNGGQSAEMAAKIRAEKAAKIRAEAAAKNRLNALIKRFCRAENSCEFQPFSCQIAPIPAATSLASATAPNSATSANSATAPAPANSPNFICESEGLELAGALSIKSARLSQNWLPPQGQISAAQLQASLPERLAAKLELARIKPAGQALILQDIFGPKGAENMMAPASARLLLQLQNHSADVFLSLQNEANLRLNLAARGCKLDEIFALLERAGCEFDFDSGENLDAKNLLATCQNQPDFSEQFEAIFRSRASEINLSAQLAPLSALHPAFIELLGVSRKVAEEIISGKIELDLAMNNENNFQNNAAKTAQKTAQKTAGELVKNCSLNGEDCKNLLENLMKFYGGLEFGK